MVRLGCGAFSAHSFGDDLCVRRVETAAFTQSHAALPTRCGGSRWDGWPFADSSAARLCHGLSTRASTPHILEAPMSVGKQQTARAPHAAYARSPEKVRAAAEACAKLTTLPVRHEHAAGIDVGDATHWVCVDATPDGSDTVREFAAHTPGLRRLVAWLRQCGVTTIALEATGVYGHVLFLTLLEAGFHVITIPPQFARQIKGRPKTDKRDCQWIQRLHKLGLLPSIFQPDEATYTLRDHVRQRANLVRLSGQHIQRMQKALELMNLKLTQVLGDITGVTGVKIIRAIVKGERDPQVLAQLRDKRCRHSDWRSSCVVGRGSWATN